MCCSGKELTLRGQLLQLAGDAVGGSIECVKRRYSRYLPLARALGSFEGKLVKLMGGVQ